MGATLNIQIISVFSIIIIVALIADFYCHKKQKQLTLSSAVIWSIFWIFLAFIFYGYLWITIDHTSAHLFLVGYLLEKSLSFDNLFVFMAIFSSFNINQGILQHKILFWGIFGAIVFRAIFVLLGTSLFKLSSVVELIFAIFIIFTAYKMWKSKNDNTTKNQDFSKHWSIKWIGKIIPSYPGFYQNKLFVTNKELESNNLIEKVTRKGKIYATPAFLCLIIIEISDIAFAFDSVPAIIAITNEPILVYSAIMFAILGLRSLYFVLEVLAKKLIYLENSIIALLFFIAGKMLLQFTNHYTNTIYFNISPTISLIIVTSILAIGVIASLLAKKKS